MSSIDVWLPRDFSRTDLARGSGIVGQNMAGGKVEIYYEGNLYGAENLQRYVERVMHSWDRMAQRYPTTARSVVPREHIIWIGKYSTVMGKIMVEPESRRLLAQWLELDEIPETELNL